jgi:hypothetical protein
MSERELELRNKVANGESNEAIASAIALCTEFLFVREDFEEAELILLEKVGLQSFKDGYALELTLGDLYIRMEENSRASRFLDIARTSSNEVIKQSADAFITKLQQVSPET